MWLGRQQAGPLRMRSTCRVRTSLPLLSDRIESHSRMISGSANSCVSRSVIHRNAKNWYDICKDQTTRKQSAHV